MATDRERKLSTRYVLGDLLVDANFPDFAAALDPDEETQDNLSRLAALIDRIVEQFPGKWSVMSGYRDRRLNDACRSAGLPASVDSLHLDGCAADIKPLDDVDLESVFEWISEQSRRDLPVHEAVYYPNKGFIHVAVENKKRPTAKRIIMRT